MNLTLNKTIQFATGKSGLENTTQKELLDLVSEYPYFAAAQLVYSAKLKQDRSSQLQVQMQKTGLFFTNARWLQYQLMDIDVKSFRTESVTDNNNFDNTYKSNSNSKNGQFSVDNKGTLIDNIEVSREVEQLQSESFTTEEKVAKPIDFIGSLNIPSINDVKNILNGIDNEKLKVNLPVVFNETEENNEIEIKNEPEISEKPAIENYDYKGIAETVEHDEKPEKINDSETSSSINDIHAEIAALKASWQKVHSDNFVEEFNSNTTVDNNVEINVEAKLNDVAEKEETVETKQELIEEKNETKHELSEKVTEVIQPTVQDNLSSTLTSFKQDWNKPAESFAAESFSFETEPYYTIDYFASQGIKFDYTQNPTDKLTSKMLKFTDWLKKMKNTKYEPEIKEDPELDKAIQNIALSSNQSKEIVTETMAEIFAKQGKTEQAIQLYIKLSFLIPDKTSYFATRIKELKGI